MPSPVDAVAVKSGSRYGALTMNSRQFTGLWTQRSPYRDANTPYLAAKFYSGSKFDSIIDGLNREISVRLTDVRSPGSSIFCDDRSFSRITSFYSWKYLTDGDSVVRVLADEAGTGKVWDITGGVSSLLLTRQGPFARFLGVIPNLYVGDGVQPKEILRSTRSWTAFMKSSPGDRMIDSNGNVQVMQYSPETLAITSTAVIDTPFAPKLVVTFSSVPPDLPNNAPVSFSGLSSATYLNGQTFLWRAQPDAVVSAVQQTTHQLIFDSVHATYADTPDTGSAIAQTGEEGTAGATQPVWSATLGATTNDGGNNGGINWVNYGSPVVDWGPEKAPLTAPNADGTLQARYWQPNLRKGGFGAEIYSILDPNGDVQVLNVSSLVVGSSNPPIWKTTLGAITNDGTIPWVNYGTISPWYASNNYGGTTLGAANPCCISDSNGNLQVVDDLATSKTSGTTEPVWATNVGGVTTDGGITWVNIGTGSILWSGEFKYSFSWHYIDGSLSNPAPAATIPSGGLGVSGGFQFAVTGQVSARQDCDQVYVWRTAQDQSTLQLVGKIPNKAGFGPAWLFFDTFADADLNPFILAPVPGTATDATPPPATVLPMCFALDRIWAADGNVLRYTNGPKAATGGNGLTQMSPINTVTLSGKIYFCEPITVQNGGIIVFTDDGIKIVLWTYTSDGTPVFYATDYYSQVSIRGYNCVGSFGTSKFVMESNRKVSKIRMQYPFDPATGYEEIGFPIGDQFKKVTTGGFNAALFDPATACVSWNNQDTEENALYVADTNTGWFRLSAVSPPESGYMWSPIRAIEGGTSAVQSLQTNTSNVNQLLMGPKVSGPILVRDAFETSAYTDNGTAYDAWDAKGANVLASTGEWAEVAHIAALSAAVGARPVVSVLLNEIKPSTQRPYTPLKPSQDPSIEAKVESVFSDRYVLLQNGKDTTCFALITKFNYGTQAAADELLDWQIYASVTDEREAAAANG